MAAKKKQEIAFDKGQTQALGGHYQAIIQGDDNDLHANNPDAQKALQEAKAAGGASKEKILQNDPNVPNAFAFADTLEHAHEEDIILEVESVDMPFIRGGVRFTTEPCLLVVGDNHQSEVAHPNVTYVSVDAALRIYRETQRGICLTLVRSQYLAELEKLL